MTPSVAAQPARLAPSPGPKRLLIFSTNIEVLLREGEQT